ncbi:MAG: sodium:solute symporter [Candidatus Aminicenantes bacterium]|nr:MAG: sodium:solute symporter [Candidatus Aminicenantes bacterium]
MSLLDWIIIISYAGGLIVLGWRLGLKQKSSEDYYLAGRKLPWLPIGFSTMATQLGAISFISAPAFVALKEGGGVRWLGYELALPLAMIVLMAFLFPVFHSLRIISVYEFLERRYDASTRVVMSLIFQVSRGLATGVTVYAAAIVLSVTVQIPLTVTILLIGAVAVVYELFGGIHVDIISDTIQMIVILLGIAITGIVGLRLVGGWGALPEVLDSSRFLAVDFSSHGLGDSRDYGFWPLFLGGFFLYASYYGCDQSQVQRELSARSLKECKLSLLFNGFFRFPIVLGYCTVGLILGAYVAQNPAFLSRLPRGDIDYLLPTFILANMPAGIIGLIFIAIMAAAMSSLDSSINSLSAATMEDIYKKLRKVKITPRQEMRLSKIFTLSWGVFCIGFAFFVGDISTTVIESINKIGSVFYGPIFAVFLMGIVFSKAKPLTAIVGLVTGVVFNLFLWIFVSSVSWLWWNAIGFLLAAAVIFLGGLFVQPTHKSPIKIEMPLENRSWKISYGTLIIYVIGLILFLVFFPKLF